MKFSVVQGAFLLGVPALFVASGVLAAPAAAEQQKRDDPSSSSAQQDLITKLLLAPTAGDRIGLLEDKDFVFDFGARPAGSPGVASGLGGRIVGANRKTMPSLIGFGSAVAVGFLGPCGFNTPHIHPRGTETQTVAQGSLVTTMLLENGVRPIRTNLTQYQMTFFPQGSMHQQYNPDCEPAVFIAGFNNEDPGTQQTQDTFFMLEDEVIKAAFGGGEFFDGEDIDRVRNMIPKSAALGVEQCWKKCGIPKRK
jgi:hypothetical protein